MQIYVNYYLHQQFQKIIGVQKLIKISYYQNFMKTILKTKLKEQKDYQIMQMIRNSYQNLKFGI